MAKTLENPQHFNYSLHITSFLSQLQRQSGCLQPNENKEICCLQQNTAYVFFSWSLRKQFKSLVKEKVIGKHSKWQQGGKTEGFVIKTSILKWGMSEPEVVADTTKTTNPVLSLQTWSMHPVSHLGSLWALWDSPAGLYTKAQHPSFCLCTTSHLDCNHHLKAHKLEPFSYTDPSKSLPQLRGTRRTDYLSKEIKLNWVKRNFSNSQDISIPFSPHFKYRHVQNCGLCWEKPMDRT